MTALPSGGWSLAEYATDLGHVAVAYKACRRISVAAPSSVLAWQILWTQINSARAFEDGS
jgi:hypothetical protein